jgi:hypothetical protein
MQERMLLAQRGKWFVLKNLVAPLQKGFRADKVSTISFRFLGMILYKIHCGNESAMKKQHHNLPTEDFFEGIARYSKEKVCPSMPTEIGSIQEAQYNASNAVKYVYTKVLNNR